MNAPSSATAIYSEPSLSAPFHLWLYQNRRPKSAPLGSKNCHFEDSFEIAATGHHRDTMVAEQSTAKPEDKGHDFFLNYAVRGKLRSLDLSAAAFWRVLDPPLANSIEWLKSQYSLDTQEKLILPTPR